jgi:hypothetical protein
VPDRIPDRFAEVEDDSAQDREESEYGEHAAPGVVAKGLTGQRCADEEHGQYEETDGLIPPLPLPAPPHETSIPSWAALFRNPHADRSMIGCLLV